MIASRRVFLAGAGAAAGLFGLASAGGGESPKQKPAAVLKLSSQLGLIPGKSLGDKLAQMEAWGFEGVELPGNVADRLEEFRRALANSKLKPSAVCWGSINGDLVSEVVEKRKPAMEQFRRVLDAAGQLGSTGVIYVPAFNGQTKLGNQEIRQILVDTLPRLGEHAVQAGTRILLEPLNRREAFFLRQLADAAAICRDCNHPAVCMMGDFYHMAIEETSDLGAFISAGSYLHHVHLASRTRVLPGQDDRQFVDGFRGLKWIGYQDFCSFECGVRGDPKVEIPKSMAFLRDQWAQA